VSNCLDKATAFCSVAKARRAVADIFLVRIAEQITHLGVGVDAIEGQRRAGTALRQAVEIDQRP
jgi:hypothetical protein